MAEKDINAQEAPAAAVAIDGYEEIARGGSKLWDKVKYHVIRTGVILGALAASYGMSKADFHNNEYKIGAMVAPVLFGFAVASSIKNDKDNNKTADFTKYAGR